MSPSWSLLQLSTSIPTQSIKNLGCRAVENWAALALHNTRQHPESAKSILQVNQPPLKADVQTDIKCLFSRQPSLLRNKYLMRLTLCIWKQPNLQTDPGKGRRKQTELLLIPFPTFSYFSITQKPFFRSSKAGPKFLRMYLYLVTQIYP